MPGQAATQRVQRDTVQLHRSPMHHLPVESPGIGAAAPVPAAALLTASSQSLEHWDFVRGSPIGQGGRWPSLLPPEWA